MKTPPHHPFRSAKAKDKYLKRYDERASSWPGESETRTVVIPNNQSDWGFFLNNFLYKLLNTKNGPKYKPAAIPSPTFDISDNPPSQLKGLSLTR